MKTSWRKHALPKTAGRKKKKEPTTSEPQIAATHKKGGLMLQKIIAIRSTKSAGQSIYL